MSEKRKGRMLSATPNGRNWTDARGNVNYEFMLSFDNGDSGKANARSATGSYKIGEEYNYERELKTYNNEQYWQFKGVQNASYVPNAPKGGQRSPEDQKQIINQVALICANNIMTKVDAEYNDLYLHLKNWLYMKIFSLSENPISTQGVIKIACEYYREAAIKTVTLTQLTDLADKLMNTVKNTTWTDPNMISPQTSTPQSYLGAHQSPPVTQSPPPGYNPPPTSNPFPV